MSSNEPEFPFREVTPEEIERTLMRARQIRDEYIRDMWRGAVRFVRQAVGRLARAGSRGGAADREGGFRDDRELTA